MAAARVCVATLLATAVHAARTYARYPNSDVTSVSETLFQITNATNNVSALSQYCDATPSCIGFNTNGWLKNGSTSLGPNPVDVYLVVTSPAPPFVPVWPAPRVMSVGETVLTLAPNTAFTAPNTSADLQAAFQRTAAKIFNHGSGAGRLIGPTASSILVQVVCVTCPLTLGVDESYTLDVPDDGSPIVIQAETVFGAYAALETLSQLVTFDFDTGSYVCVYAPVHISDAPAFTWRGVMVDPARHFLPLSLLMTTIDSMTYAKLNALHVHVVDCDSWPLAVLPGTGTDFSDLWLGAFSPRERYTVADLKSLVEYGRQRGVRVIFEFDSPGHAGSMCEAHPDLCPSPECREPLNPASPNTLPALNAVIQTLVNISIDEVVHLGGDEVNPACWAASPEIQAWMQLQNFTSTDQIYEYFVAYTNKVAVEAGRSPMRWQEVYNHFGSQLDNSTIVHAWLDIATMVSAANAGYRTVFSVDNDAYYMDYLDVTWDRTYDMDFLANVTFNPPEAVKNVLGGEVALWEETVDASTLLLTLWPRAAAAAERLWSYNFPGRVPNGVTAQSADAVNRMAQFRCLLLERGIPAASPGNTQAGSMGPAWTVGSCGGGYFALC